MLIKISNSHIAAVVRLAVAAHPDRAQEVQKCSAALSQRITSWSSSTPCATTDVLEYLDRDFDKYWLIGDKPPPEVTSDQGSPEFRAGPHHHQEQGTARRVGAARQALR
jgi:hypothetical protein